MAPVDYAGEELHQATDDGEAETLECGTSPLSSGGLAWDQTLFRAAVDAADGIAWPRSNSGEDGSGGSWRTQGRHLELVASLLGLGPSADSPLVGMLAIPALHHHEARAAYAASAGYRSRGLLLSRLTGTLLDIAGSLLDALLDAGFQAGLWGQPWRCDPHRHGLRPVNPRARSP